MSRLISGMLVTLLVSTTACTTEFKKGMHMDIQRTTLWQLIGVLGPYPSLAPDKIKQVLPTDFSERRRSTYTSFYVGGPLQLADQINIEAIDLRVRLMNEMKGLVVLSIAGACVTLHDVHLHYQDIRITAHPRGHSLDEKTSWSTYQPWGKLSFGFKERNPDCLASVTINRSDPLPTQSHQTSTKAVRS